MDLITTVVITTNVSTNVINLIAKRCRFTKSILKDRVNARNDCYAFVANLECYELIK